jgi:putative transcriptional regulator
MRAKSERADRREGTPLKAEIFKELKERVRAGGVVLRGKAAPAGQELAGQTDVKDLRAAYGLSQRQFAALLGISVATLQNWEQGRRLPKGAARVLILIAASYPEMVWAVVKPMLEAGHTRGNPMASSNSKTFTRIPPGLIAHFQEYDAQALNIAKDANLIIQRTLEFGTWDELRWLFEAYGARKIRAFLRRYGEKWLRPVDFNYWRKLLRLRNWRRSGLPTPKGELWDN